MKIDPKLIERPEQPLTRNRDAYHAWVLRETPQGCHVLTEEVQHGLLAQLQKKVWPGRMYRYHQIWLEALAAKAKDG